jgi:hypothetical protein
MTQSGPLETAPGNFQSLNLFHPCILMEKVAKATTETELKGIRIAARRGDIRPASAIPIPNIL